MKERFVEKEYQRLTTPRAAAVAGILFALLFGASLILFRSAVPADPSTGVEWVEQGADRIRISLALMPFAGIAFLWFIGVVRDRLGDYEDRFFSTVFFGSSLLFLAMVFISLGIAGGILNSYRLETSSTLDEQIVNFGRATMFQITNVYALRMAGVCMISLGTIALRTRIMPRWLALVTFLLALVLLFVTSLSLWTTLVFPAWVLVISLFILVSNYRQMKEDAR